MIEDKVYPEIEDKVYPSIETEEKLMIEEESTVGNREKLQQKVKDFIEELKMDGYISTYDSYEFENLYEFIIKINK